MRKSKSPARRFPHTPRSTRDRGHFDTILLPNDVMRPEQNCVENINTHNPPFTIFFLEVVYLLRVAREIPRTEKRDPAKTLTIEAPIYSRSWGFGCSAGPARFSASSMRPIRHRSEGRSSIDVCSSSCCSASAAAVSSYSSTPPTTCGVASRSVLTATGTIDAPPASQDVEAAASAAGGGGNSGGDDGAVGLNPSLVSGFALDRLAEEEEIASFETDSKSETSDTSSSSGSSAVGAYAMYSLSAREEGRSSLDCEVDGIVGALCAKSRNDCSRSSSDGGQRLASGNDHFVQQASVAIPKEEGGLSAAVASNRSFGKVRAFSSQCLEGLDRGEGTGGGATELRRWRGRSESEARISGAYVFELYVMF